MVCREMKHWLGVGDSEYWDAAVCGVCSTRGMLYSVYAVLGVCSTRCMMYSVNAVLVDNSQSLHGVIRRDDLSS